MTKVALPVPPQGGAYHPAAREPVLASLVAALLLAISAGLFLLVAPLTALVLSFGLWGSLAAFFLPSRYTLQEQALIVRVGPLTQRYPWARFRRVLRDRNGLLLSPFTKPHKLDSFRGVFLPLDPESARRLAPLLEARLR